MAPYLDEELTLLNGFDQQGSWIGRRTDNIVDGGASFDRSYATKDGKFVVVGAIEPHYYANLGKVMGLDGENLPEQNDRAAWPKMGERFAQISPCECAMNGWRLPRGEMPVLHLC